MAEAKESDSPVKIGEALVYGLTNREGVQRLIQSLSEIPCCPLLIFRINARKTRGDNLARWLGVYDALSKETYYVRIISWGSRRKKLPPVIGWSLDPRRYSHTLRSRAKKAHLEYATELRGKPMVVRYDAQAIMDRHAKRACAAS